MSLITIKSRWKSILFSILIITMSVASFVSINSAVEAANGYVTKNMLETPVLRTLYVWSEDLYTEEQLNQLKADERVTSFFEFSYETCVEMSLGERKDKNAAMTPYFSEYDNYIIKGCGAKNENEIVLPYYIADGNGESKSYKKNDTSLLNKYITFSYDTINYYSGEVEKTEDVQVKVVGFFDNAAAGLGGNEYLLYDKTLTEVVKEAKYIPESEEELSKISEMMGFENVKEMISIFEGEERNPGELGVCAKTYEFTKELEQEYGLLRYAIADENVEYEFSSLKFIGDILSFILLLIALINIIISTINGVNRRQWEFALKQAMGFKYKHLYKGIAAEGLVVAVLGIVFGLISGVAVLQLIKYQYMAAKNIAYITMDIDFDIKYVVQGTFVAIVPPLAGSIIGMIKIKAIKVTTVLKTMEWRRK